MQAIKHQHNIYIPLSLSLCRQLPEHVKRAAMEAASSDDDTDDEDDASTKFAAGWGKKR